MTTDPESFPEPTEDPPASREPPEVAPDQPEFPPPGPVNIVTEDAESLSEEELAPSPVSRWPDNSYLSEAEC